MSSVTRAVLVGCLCLLLLGAGVTAPALASAGNPASSQVQLGTPENNSTTQHERPEEAASDGSQADVRRWLEGRLGDALAESTIKLSQGQYEAADDLLGEEYESYFAKYVDVAGDTGEADSKGEQALADAKSQQQEYVSLVQQYQSTYEKYQTARANGNETRARQLARKLQNISENISQQSGSLEQTLRDVGNETTANVSQSIRRIQSITKNISALQQTITTATFVETSMTATLQNSSGSYLNPFIIEGRLATNQSATLPNNVTISVDGTRYTAQIGADGAFNVTYRPTTAPAGEQSLEIAYVPRTESVFLASNASLNASINPVTPTVELSVAQQAATYADPLHVDGTVVANGTPVAGVPVAISIGDVSLGTVRTTANGTFELRTQLPAAVDAGTPSLTATIAQENRAIATTGETTTITVRESETNLSLNATVHSGSFRLTGRLTTVDGTPASNQAITIMRNGTQVSSVQTNESGYFVAPVPRPADPANFSAHFDGSTTNLANSRATVIVDGSTTALANSTSTGAVEENPASNDGQLPWESSGSQLPWIIGGVLLIVITLAGGGYGYRRRSQPSQDPDDAATSTPDMTESDSQPSPQPETPIADLEARGPSADALAELYGVVRHSVAESAQDDVTGRTHWEFYQAVATELGDDEQALRTLTEAYEAVQYGDERITARSWAQLVTAAEPLLDRTVFDGQAAKDE